MYFDFQPVSLLEVAFAPRITRIPKLGSASSPCCFRLLGLGSLQNQAPLTRLCCNAVSAFAQFGCALQVARVNLDEARAAVGGVHNLHRPSDFFKDL